MPVVIGDILEVTAEGLILGQTTLSVLHYVVGQTPTQNDPILSQAAVLALINGGASDLSVPYRGCCGTSFQLTRWWAQYIWPTRYIKSTSFVGLNGNFGGASSTSNIAGTIQKASIFAGKKNRGSLHMPGVADNQMNAGELAVALIARYTTLATALTTNIVEGGGGVGRWDPIILHRTKPLNGTYARWEHFTVHDELRTMRRRTLGLGI